MTKQSTVLNRFNSRFCESGKQLENIQYRQYKNVSILSRRLLLTGFASFCFFFVAAASLFAANPILKNESVSIEFGEKSGQIEKINYQGDSLLTGPQKSCNFDLNENGRWQFGTPRETLAVQKRSALALVAKYKKGNWTIELLHKLDAKRPILRITAKLTWNGTEPTKLKGFWWDLATLSANEKSFFYGPGNYPTQHFQFADEPIGKSRHFSRHTPSVIVEQKPNRSILFIIDDLCRYGDPCSCAAEKRSANDLRISQTFHSLALMKPGASQTIGDAYFQILDCNGEQALYKIHDWMAEHGHVIPKDRPDWFAKMNLYSFHPGGTTGSNCRDQGGFRASLPLLDRVQKADMNAIWIMPIEDVSLYNPRDYYKFQAGLGTPEEYKELVQTAHQKKLHVLQDNVPHGGSNPNERSIAHPEWLLQNEDGSTLSYWGFDFNWPSWREYIAKVIAYYIEQYDIDGYRVDAVAGSKSANWNPDIPYERASFALRQGGLNMLRSIRKSALTANKPSNSDKTKTNSIGILAEAGGSVYGAVADAVYDFRGCYSMQQDMRRLSPAQFVQQIRQTLHEEQYSEIKDLLRLRHAESHDSLRSRLLYGIEPMRALVAFTTYIHGIPLVYHEQEIGNLEPLRKIFAIKNQLPELQGGDVDYLSVKVPDGVFACRRWKENRESIVLINFNFEPVAFPLDLGNATVATDMSSQKPAGIQNGKTQIVLKPYQYNVIALRKIDFHQEKTVKRSETTSIAQTTTEAASKDDSFDSSKKSLNETQQFIELKGERYRAQIDPQTGLLAAYEADGKILLNRASIFVPVGLRASAGKAVADKNNGKSKVYTFTIPFEKTSLEIKYTAEKDGLAFESRWLGTETPENAALLLPVANAKNWSVMSAEGFQQDDFIYRDEKAVAYKGTIYWRVQGTEVLFDSLMNPFEFVSGTPMFLAAGNRSGQEALFLLRGNPARAQFHSKIDDKKNPSLSFSWSDPAAVKLSPDSRTVAFKIIPGQLEQYRDRAEKSFASKKQDAPWNLIPVAGGWLFENKYYTLRLKRNGSLTALTMKKENAKKEIESIPVVQNGEIYTDNGFSGGESARMRFSSENEVENAIAIQKESNGVRLRFEGHLRGFGRFENLGTPVLYSFDWLLGPEPFFDFESSTQYTGRGNVDSCFLSNYFIFPTVNRFVFSKNGSILADDNNLNAQNRAWQCRDNKAFPDRIEFFADQEKLLDLTAVETGELANLFFQKKNFFAAFADSSPIVGQKEMTFRARFNLGDAGKTPVLPNRKVIAKKTSPKKTGLIQNPNFEQSSLPKLIAIDSNATLPLYEGSASFWDFRPGALPVTDVVKEGKFAVKLNSSDGSYFLLRQRLDAKILKPGETYRISCQARGENILQGDIGWKSGTVRLAVGTEKGQYYQSSDSLTGSFDWKNVAFEFTVPENLTQLVLEAGLNGATGSIWFDSFKMEKIK